MLLLCPLKNLPEELSGGRHAAIASEGRHGSYHLEGMAKGKPCMYARHCIASPSLLLAHTVMGLLPKG